MSRPGLKENPCCESGRDSSFREHTRSVFMSELLGQYEVKKGSASLLLLHIHPRRQAFHEFIVIVDQLVHLVQDFHSLISSQWAHIVQVLPIKLINDTLSPFGAPKRAIGHDHRPRSSSYLAPRPLSREGPEGLTSCNPETGDDALYRKVEDELTRGRFGFRSIKEEPNRVPPFLQCYS